MKKLVLSITLALAATISAWAQAPQKFNYQGIARDNNGAPLANQNLGIRITIHDGSPTGTAVYTETEPTITTNSYGLYNLTIGGVNPITGVNWATGNKYIQVEMDPAGGNSYVSVATPQLLSVPYAMYAAAAPASPITGTSGGVFYGTGNGTPAQFTPAGTAGQVLTSNGAGAPTWQTPAAGGTTTITKTFYKGLTTTTSMDGLSDYPAGETNLLGFTNSTNGIYYSSNYWAAYDGLSPLPQEAVLMMPKCTVTRIRITLGANSTTFDNSNFYVINATAGTSAGFGAIGAFAAAGQYDATGTLTFNDGDELAIENIGDSNNGAIYVERIEVEYTPLP
jgi:hypothetical protein